MKVQKLFTELEGVKVVAAAKTVLEIWTAHLQPLETAIRGVGAQVDVFTPTLILTKGGASQQLSHVDLVRLINELREDRMAQVEYQSKNRPVKRPTRQIKIISFNKYLANSRSLRSSKI
jgi:hypothetical protein